MPEIRPTTPTPKPSGDPGRPYRVGSVTGRGRQASDLSAGGARRLGWSLLAVADNADREGGAGVS